MLNLDLLNSFLAWRMKKRIHQIELFMKYPAEVQSEWLSKLLRTARTTEVGRAWGFDSITNYETFRERVPLHRYEDLEKQINRVRNGEQNVLWPTEIRWFAKSSGTTSSKSKFIPVSQEAIEECHFNAGKDMLCLYVNNHPETKLFSGKGLRLGGSTAVNNQSNDSFYGDLSAIIIENLPIWVTMRSTPNNRISLMSEWESKIEAIARTTLREDVTSLAGVPSWMLVLAHKVLELSGKEHLHEVWPNLELYMHGGVSFNPYRDRFRQLLPGASMNYMEIYNASEGFFGIQDSFDSRDLLLMLDYGIFFEFIPMDRLEDEHPLAIPIDEVEPGVNYALVISTNAGLWRYLVGDTVMFSSVSPYRFRITGRTKHFINAFGEELIVENAETAMEVACRRTRAQVVDYTAAPVFMHGQEGGAHEWLIEFSRPPDNLEDFVRHLDQALKDLNSDYEAKRHKSMALREPQLQLARTGLFYDWLKANGKLGGQHKVPRLSNDRKVMDLLLSMNQSAAS